MNNILGAEVINRLEQDAQLHKRYSNIEFKILNATNNAIAIEVRQGRHLSENYATQKRLTEIVHETFDVCGKKIDAMPVIFQKSKTEIVTPEWINEKMNKDGIKLKQIVEDTGVDKTNLSAWANGKRPMSQVAKAMLYYYFKAI